ncbi:hypothetical protein [Lactobacillus phage JNU_P2]|nr:hypothetical protein [Lactobacillus phage JNU_P2]QHJ74929.1 hypothetical protein [Lactobacillus phage JNU_P4]
MIKRPDWYEKAVRELQEQHDKPEGRSLGYQRLQLKVDWWQLMEAWGVVRARNWLLRRINSDRAK